MAIHIQSPLVKLATPIGCLVIRIMRLTTRVIAATQMVGAMEAATLVEMVAGEDTEMNAELFFWGCLVIVVGAAVLVVLGKLH